MPTEKFLSELYDLSPSEWLKLLPEYMSRRFAPDQQTEAAERVINTMRLHASDEAKEKMCPFQRGRLKASEIPDVEEELPRLWFGVYPGALTFLCGESGAGKSSILYNMGIHAARNEPLWNIPFGMHRPIKILYVDPENSGDFDRKRAGLCRKKVERIAQGKPELLEFHDGQGINLAHASTLADLQSVIIEEKFDVLILDPIINLFGTKDENDNAEAALQFSTLRGLIKTTNVAIVAVHHTGRDATSVFGRGATSRFGMADVVLSLRARNEQEDYNDDYGEGDLHERNDIIRLRIEKNRIEPGKASLFLQMVGEDRFERVGFEDWKSATRATDQKAPKKQQGEEFVFDYLQSEKDWRSTETIYQAMQKKGIGERNTDKAIKSLMDDGTIQRKFEGRGGKAHYRVSPIVLPPDPFKDEPPMPHPFFTGDTSNDD